MHLSRQLEVSRGKVPMKSTVRCIAAAVAACAIMTGLSACGNNNAATKDGKPVVSVMVVKDARTKKMSSLPWARQLEKKCNCYIKWQEGTDDSWNNQKKASLAAGEVPDVTIDGFNSGDMSQFGSLFLDLKPELKHMPNVSKMFTTDPYAKIVSTTIDGKILGTPSVARPLNARTSSHLFINKAWLDKLGRKVPTTWDEFEDDLKAFKTGDPNGNGKHDEIPFDFNSPNTSGFGAFEPNVLLSSFGIVVPMSAYGMYVHDGKVSSYFTDPRYKQLISWLHRMWSEGLISNEAFTHDWSKYEAVAKGDGKTARVGATIMWTPSDIFGSNLGKQYITIPSLKYDANQTVKPVWSYSGDGDAYAPDKAVISAKAANKEAALKLVDAMYSPDMSVQMRYGSFGSCVKKNGTSNYTVLEPSDKTKNASDWQFENALGDRAPIWIDNSMKLNLPKEQTEVRSVDAVYDPDFKNVNFNSDILYQNMPTTDDETNTMARNATGITQFAMSSFASWVTKGGVDKGWDSYVQKLNKNKLGQQLQIEQTIYNRYKKTLKSNNVDLTKLLNW